MDLLIVAITFVSALFVVLILVYGFSGGGAGAAAGGRLTELWTPAVAKKQAKIADKQKERASKLLQDVAKLLPEASGKQLTGLRKRLVHAGFRNPDTVMTFRGARVLLVGGAVAAVYFSGYFRQNFVMAMFIVVAAFMAPDFWLTRKVRLRRHRLRLSLPDALDLMVICVEAGLGLDQAILRVSQELKSVHPELSDEFHLVNLEMRVGKPRAEALRDMVNRTGVDDIKSLVGMLLQTDRFGTSIAQALRVHSDTLRTKRRQRAEEAAAKTPVKMVPVLVFFIFPALLIVILGPAIITLWRQLVPMMGG